MPLNTQIIRDGEPMKIRWGNFHIAAMALAASFDSGTGPVSSPDKVYEAPPGEFDCYPDAPFPISRQVSFMLAEYGALGKTPLNEGSYTLTKRHKFMDMMDGEILALLPGDILRAWRN